MVDCADGVGGVVGADESSPPHSAVLADLVDRTYHQRLRANPLFDGGNIAGRDHRGEFRRLAVRRGHEVREHCNTLDVAYEWRPAGLHLLHRLFDFDYLFDLHHFFDFDYRLDFHYFFDFDFLNYLFFDYNRLRRGWRRIRPAGQRQRYYQQRQPYFEHRTYFHVTPPVGSILSQQFRLLLSITTK